MLCKEGLYAVKKPLLRYLNSLILVTLFIDAKSSEIISNMKEEYKLKTPIFISLGSRCNVAIHLKRTALREASFPFDWLSCSDLNIYTEFIRKNFSNFCLPINLIRLNRSGKHAWIEDVKFGVFFLHDFPLELTINQAINDVREKYNRRIIRFYETLAIGRPIIFVRSSTPNEPTTLQ